MKALATLLAAASLTACVTPASGPPKAPQPAKPVDAARLYSGTWHEIGRLPMKMTDGCVAGTTAYADLTATQVKVLDACHVGAPDGKLKTIGGRGEILDPGTNAKLRVHYRALGFWPITWDFWVLDHADDYSWFISADPSFERLFIFTRSPVSTTERERLTKRAQSLGYDVSRLEYPAQPPG